MFIHLFIHVAKALSGPDIPAEPFLPLPFLYAMYETHDNNNNSIYLVWPRRGIWLHRTTAHSASWAGVQAKIPGVTVVTLCH
jgi:hypothetical protein